VALEQSSNNGDRQGRPIESRWISNTYHQYSAYSQEPFPLLVPLDVIRYLLELPGTRLRHLEMVLVLSS
jgi:hypothetical protein